MDVRVLMARFSEEWKLRAHENSFCSCGSPFFEGETVLLYPNPEYNDVRMRDIVCLTCHFWFVNDVMEEMGA